MTISDLVADHRALTPSHAVTDLTPDREALLAGLSDLGDRLRARVTRRLEIDPAAARRPGRTAACFGARSTACATWRKRLDDLDGALARSAARAGGAGPDPGRGPGRRGWNHSAR